MGIFSFINKRRKPTPKSYPLAGPEVMDLVTDVCSALQVQYQFLKNGEHGVPPLVTQSDGTGVVDLWLAGYLCGFYDASSQYRGLAFELNALELIFSVLYNEEDAAGAIKEYHVARLTLDSNPQAAILFGYDEFEKGMLSGGNDVFDWANKKIECALSLYKRYS